MEDIKRRGETQQLVVGEAEFPTPGMLVMEVVVDGEGLIQQDAAGFQCVDESGKE
jgi:hypothetical protein